MNDIVSIKKTRSFTPAGTTGTETGPGADEGADFNEADLRGGNIQF